MKFSYEKIGAWSATFATETAVEGQVVKMSADHTVAACSDNDVFCGVADVVRNGICGVQMSGMAEVCYSGSAPAVGNATLAADGKGGVCTASSGQTYLVVSVDTAKKTCVIKL